jgi:hypothetical protein
VRGLVFLGSAFRALLPHLPNVRKQAY